MLNAGWWWKRIRDGVVTIWLSIAWTSYSRLLFFPMETSWNWATGFVFAGLQLTSRALSDIVRVKVIC